MSISNDMRSAVRALMAHYNAGQLPPGFMRAFDANFSSLAERVEQLETTVVPGHARGVRGEELPGNVVPFTRPRTASGHAADGGAA